MGVDGRATPLPQGCLLSLDSLPEGVSGSWVLAADPGPKPPQRPGQAGIVDGGGRQRFSVVDRAGRGVRRVIGSGHRRLQKAKLRNGPIAEIGVHPLQDLLGAMLELDCPRAFDLEYRTRPAAPPRALAA